MSTAVKLRGDTYTVTVDNYTVTRNQYDSDRWDIVATDGTKLGHITRHGRTWSVLVNSGASMLQWEERTKFDAISGVLVGYKPWSRESVVESVDNYSAKLAELRLQLAQAMDANLEAAKHLDAIVREYRGLCDAVTALHAQLVRGGL